MTESYLVSQNEIQATSAMIGTAIGMYFGYSFAAYAALKGVAEAVVIGAGATAGNIAGIYGGNVISKGKPGEYFYNPKFFPYGIGDTSN